MEKVYIVSVESGSYDDYQRDDIFATKSLTLAINWCERFNGIVKQNTDRINNFDTISNLKRPFWFNGIRYGKMSAFINKIELRKLRR